MQIINVCKHFKINNLGECYALYILKIYELDPAKTFSAPGLAWKAALHKTQVKLDLLTNIDLLISRKRY